MAHQLTQEELADRAGVTKGFISLLERNKSSVSLETLTAVLEVLGEPLSAFFSADAMQPFVFGKQDRTPLEDRGCDKFELLVPGSTTMAMEPVRMVLGPGQRFGPHASHNGEEFGYVIRGRLSISLGRRTTIAGTMAMRMAAIPLATWISPQLMRAKGATLPTSPMKASRAQTARPRGSERARRRMKTSRAMAPNAMRPLATHSGGRPETATLIKGNEPPHIAESSSNCA